MLSLQEDKHELESANKRQSGPMTAQPALQIKVGEQVLGINGTTSSTASKT